MGRTSSTRQCLWQAASGVRPAVVCPASAGVEAPPTLRIALHGHG
ncbi:hypothetical protein PV371_16665 [Streptomyces sp. TX20-6-3]|nr:hypothetical protein [Streptomyces sp. TX20-6-3]MDX2561280.1 hypothetical protein [Streptomyces sp. TX20-6-3]